MSRPRIRRDDRGFLASLIANLDRVSLEDYKAGVDGAIADLTKFAQSHWMAQSKEVLWEVSAPVWKKIRESIVRDHTDIENMAFLAAVFTTHTEATTRAAARRELGDLIDATAKKDGMDNRALQLLASLTVVQTRIVERESPTLWALCEETVTSELSTLTARTFSVGVEQSFFEEERDRTIAPSLRAVSIEKAGAAEMDLLKRLEFAEKVQEKDEILYALQVIGGCRVSQELSGRLANTEAEEQCAILAVLEKLASRPYRPGAGDKEQPVLQLETADTVLRALRELIVKPTPEHVRHLVKRVNQAVTMHRTQCFDSHH